ncbi:MAG TPA: peptidoglycan recognition family protein [Candidatus Limnocylindria bacterium]|nr:peptidoglycan recognition family protein [Candidatus Limnocylindria bacterium]
MKRAVIALIVGLLVGLSIPRATPADLPLPNAGGRGDDAPAAVRHPETLAAPEPQPQQRVEPQPRAVERRASFPYAPQPQWIPTVRNYDAGRMGERVQFIVIHYTAISYERTLRAFYSPYSRVSAHYVVRQDGHVAQTLGEADTAWHAGNYWYNQRSIGIEIELDFDKEPDPQYTPEQYYATAALTCEIAKRHGIPLDRSHVIGHNEIPGTGKLDPGRHWGWPHFMWLTTFCAPPTADTVRSEWITQTPDPLVLEGDAATVSVTLRNAGTTAWRKGTSQEARLAVRGNDQSLAHLGAGWPTADRVAAQNEQLVMPGGWATFTFAVKGLAPGKYVLPLRGVVDGGAWMDDQGIHTTITVMPRGTSTAY